MDPFRVVSMMCITPAQTTHLAFLMTCFAAAIALGTSPRCTWPPAPSGISKKDSALIAPSMVRIGLPSSWNTR